MGGRLARLGAILLLGLSVGAEARAGEFVLRVDGLACPFCAYGIEKKLLEVPGVEGIEVLLDEGRIVLELSPETSLEVAALDAAVERAGFTLRGLLVHDAVGTLSRNGGDALYLTSSDPRVKFLLRFEDEDARPGAELGSGPVRVVASGTVTDLRRAPPELVVTEITPFEDPPR